MDTQQILDTLYDAVLEKLIVALVDFNKIFEIEKSTLELLANDLEIDLSIAKDDSVEKFEFNAKKIALMSVAESCVVTVLRAFIKIAKRHGGMYFIEGERVAYIFNEDAFDWKKFPKSLGITDDDARTAVMVTSDVFLNSSIFHSPLLLTMDGDKYEIMRHLDGFSIKHKMAQ